MIAHSVGVMTVQAGAARMQLPDHPDRAVPPLLAVEETGRQALTELRRLLGILRDDDAASAGAAAGTERSSYPGRGHAARRRRSRRSRWRAGHGRCPPAST